MRPVPCFVCGNLDTKSPCADCNHLMSIGAAKMKADVVAWLEAIGKTRQDGRMFAQLEWWSAASLIESGAVERMLAERDGGGE